MTVIEKSIVNAPPEKVFAIPDDPSRVVEWVPGVVKVSNIKRTPQRIGDSATVTYNVLGLRFPTKGTVVASEPNEMMSVRMEGGINGILTLTYRAYRGATRVN